MTQILELWMYSSVIIFGMFVISKFKEDKHNGTLYLYYTFVLLFCLGYGYMEHELLRQHGTTGEKWFLNQFSTYHFIMAFIFIVVSMTSAMRLTFTAPWLNGWQNIPAMILAEDLFYRLAKGEWVTSDDWVSAGMGGIEFPDFYFPFTYIFLILVALAFYNIEFIVHKIKIMYRLLFELVGKIIDQVEK